MRASRFVFVVGLALVLLGYAAQPHDSGGVTQYDVLQGASGEVQLCGITHGPHRNIWFTVFDTKRIGRLATDGTVTSFPLSDAWGSPCSIVTGPDGDLWFTETYAARIGRITPAGGLTEFDGLADWAGGIALGPDGNLWFTEYLRDLVGRITPGGAVAQYALAPLAHPGGITSGPDGNLWFTEETGHIGRITTSGQVTEFALSHPPAGVPGSYPRSIVAGPDGNLWFTEGGPYQIGRLDPASR
jgi:streptogramin lyase